MFDRFLVNFGTTIDKTSKIRLNELFDEHLFDCVSIFETCWFRLGSHLEIQNASKSIRQNDVIPRTVLKAV